MRQQLVAKQIQNLSLTPEIKQSLRFLGLNTVDLLEELKSIALENPLIDIEETSDPQVEQETTAEGNESNRLSDLRFEVLNHHDAHRMSPVGENNFTYDKAHADHIATHIDFRQHLREQLISNNTSSEDKILCTYLVDCVDEDGFWNSRFLHLIVGSLIIFPFLFVKSTTKFKNISFIAFVCYMLLSVVIFIIFLSYFKDVVLNFYLKYK